MPPMNLRSNVTSDAAKLEAALAEFKNWPISEKGAPEVIARLDGGITNQSYLLAAENNLYVLRINSLLSVNLGVNRADELVVLERLAPHEIAPRIIYSERNFRYTLLEYIEGENLNRRHLDLPGFLDELHSTIRCYQSLEAGLPASDYLAYLDTYYSIAKNRLTKDEQSDWLLCRNRIKNGLGQHQNYQLMHHDLTPENIIVSDKGIRIIDWEYTRSGLAGLDQIYFDSFWENQLLSPRVKVASDQQNLIRMIIEKINFFWSKINKQPI